MSIVLYSKPVTKAYSFSGGFMGGIFCHNIEVDKIY